MAKKQTKKQTPLELTAKDFSQMRGIGQLNQYVLEKKYSKQKNTPAQWEDILKKERLF